jgi:putative restriction endonuclease
LFGASAFQHFSFRSSMPRLAQAIERLYHLRVDTTTRDGQGKPHEKPHKPLLLLAAFDLIDEGLATPDRIPWDQDLRDPFTTRFETVSKLNDVNDPGLPFRWLASDQFWLPLEADGTTPIRRELRIRNDSGRVFARFIDGFDILAAIPENRCHMREALVSRYFPQHAHALLGVPRLPPQPEPVTKAADDEPEYGRSPAFRRKILEIYDHQCAACGLRIRLPAAHDVSFIDAAHLVPFSENHNDHPTNGLALCKNHHWAMDRDVLAPSPDLRWHVAKAIDPRRSNGEKELHELAGTSLLLPKDRAFHPDEEGLAWRLGRLSA